jgi:UDP-glucose 4-epimerase
MTSSTGSIEDYKIIVTGASGFLGRRIIRKLLAHGTYVMGLDLVPLPSDLEELADGNRSLIHKVGDLNDPRFLDRVLNEVELWGNGNSALFHLSGLTHVDQSEADPLKAFQTNVTQTARVLEACRKQGIRRFLYPSTALVYGEHSTALLTEEHPVNPQNIYVSTKLAAEALIRGYAKSYSFSCDIARVSNVYGADANPDTAVSIAMIQAKRGGPITLRNLSPVRDFIYCEDVAEGFVRLLASGHEPGSRTYNLSTGQGTSIGQMAKMVCDVAGIKKDIVESARNDGSEKLSLVLANEQLVKRTTWRPTFSLSEGLRAAWEEMHS